MSQEERWDITEHPRFAFLDQQWADQALCTQRDPTLWFPVRGGTCRPAKAICRGCPVRVECLDWAQVTGQQYGIWGSYSTKERELLRRAERAAA
jgi:WhiB family redox-sensing transcriptional regulator